jgi:YegS/Rv2252/BmrU family lipid kinase
VLNIGGCNDRLVCSGGGGTLSVTLVALLRMERRPTFGFLPSGTTNDFATSLGLPGDLLLAADVVTGGVARPFDIGRFGEEYFSYVAAFGLFTDVSYDTPQERKNALGHMAYLMEGVKRLGAIQSHSCTVELPGEVIEGEFILGMVSNSLSIGGFRIQKEDSAVRMDDGLFEVILLRKPKNFIDLQNVIASILNQELYTDSLILRRADSLTVRTEAPIAWTLDGEFGGEVRDVAITCCHNAIEIMMPE